MTTPELNWRDIAECQFVDPELFFPEGKGGHAKRLYRQARMICGVCPVKQECLDEAMRDERDVKRQSRFGMRGGLSPDQRAALENEMKDAA